MKYQIDAREEELAEFTRNRPERINGLVAGGAAVRNHARNRQSRRSISEALGDNDVGSRPRKARRMSYGEVQRNVGDALQVPERGKR